MKIFVSCEIYKILNIMHLLSSPTHREKEIWKNVRSSGK